LLLEARALEARARLGQATAPEAPRGEANRATEGDPRALIARARAHG
jgi:hypothetical protein